MPRRGRRLEDLANPGAAAGLLQCPVRPPDGLPPEPLPAAPAREPEEELFPPKLAWSLEAPRLPLPLDPPRRVLAASRRVETVAMPKEAVSTRPRNRLKRRPGQAPALQDRRQTRSLGERRRRTAPAPGRLHPPSEDRWLGVRGVMFEATDASELVDRSAARSLEATVARRADPKKSDLWNERIEHGGRRPSMLALLSTPASRLGDSTWRSPSGVAAREADPGSFVKRRGEARGLPSIRADGDASDTRACVRLVRG